MATTDETNPNKQLTIKNIMLELTSPKNIFCMAYDVAKNHFDQTFSINF